MCLTEDRAIKDLISTWRKHMIAAITAPIRHTAIKPVFTRSVKNIMNRIAPNPPNFNIIAAKIIDPSTGAWTWALGNHKWKEKMGSLTIKGKNNKILDNKIDNSGKSCLILKTEVEPDIRKRQIKKGREENTV